MTGPTRPAQPLSINAILVIAALCAAASVLIVPKASVTPSYVASAASSEASPTDPAVSPRDQARIHRDLTANLSAIGEEAAIVFSVVSTIADAATN